MAVPGRAPSPPARRAAAIPRALVGFAIPFAVILLAIVGLRLSYADRVLPGTRLAGTSIGGDSAQELRERLTRDGLRPIIVMAGSRRLRVDPSQAGLQIDIEATLVAAMDSGRAGFLGGAGSTVKGLLATRQVDVVTRIDGGALERAVGELARSVDRQAFPGAIRIDQQLLDVTTVAPRSGRRLDQADLRQRLRDAFRRGGDEVRASVTITRVAKPEDVEAVAQEADDYLSRPVRFTGAGEPLTLTAARVAPVLRLSTRGSDGEVGLGTSAKALEQFVAGIARRRDRLPRDAEVSAPGRKVILDGKGEVSWRPQRAKVRVTRKGRSGRLLDRADAAKAIDRAVRLGEHDIRVRVKRTAPAVTAKDARALTSLIGTFTTHYEAGQPRVRNIRQMARTVDGTLVAPGAQFSLNDRVGPRTHAGGYVEAPFIADGKIVPSIGGGVSQFSTTLYNAAYFAGLLVDTHTPHSLFIDRYPAGREATLNFPSIDLKWTNDTDAPILIRTFSDETSVTVSLYGDNGGRRVRAEPGERRPIDGEDFAITVTRVIRFPGGRVARDEFTTRYDKPVPHE